MLKADQILCRQAEQASSGDALNVLVEIPHDSDPIQLKKRSILKKRSNY